MVGGLRLVGWNGFESELEKGGWGSWKTSWRDWRDVGECSELYRLTHVEYV